MKTKVIFITGPTASGKSDLAIWLAKKVSGEVINADSRQVYKDLDIGSGKIMMKDFPVVLPHGIFQREPLHSYCPSGKATWTIRYPAHMAQGGSLFNQISRSWNLVKKENVVLSKKEKIPHHLLSVASPKRNFSLGRWLQLTQRAIEDIDGFKDLRSLKLDKGKGLKVQSLKFKSLKPEKRVPIFCGGTILYLRALKEGWILPEVKSNYKLRRELEKLSVQELLAALKKIDAVRAATIETKNKRRLIRALEIAKVLGQVPKLQKLPQYELLIIAPFLPFASLEKKIWQRLKQRVPAIVQEIKKLRHLGLSFKRLQAFGLEYEWFSKYVAGQINKNKAIAQCGKDIIRFAKRQIRELKKIEDVHWVGNKEEALKLVKKFLRRY